MNFHQMSPNKLPLAGLSKAHVPNSPGVFLLFHTNIGAPAYVGRADSSLFDSLRGHVGSPIYKYFKYMPCKDRADAYQWECIFWHKAQPSLDMPESKGGHHPRAPKGIEVSCPVPGCTHRHDPAAHAQPSAEIHQES